MLNPTDERVLRKLKVEQRLTANQLYKECSIPYHHVHQVMQRMASKIEGVAYRDGTLFYEQPRSQP